MLYKDAMRRIGSASITACALILCGQVAAAATYTWNANTSGTPVDGSGTWSTSNANWWNSSDVNWINGSAAVIGAGNGAAGTVTVSGSVTASQIAFKAPGSGSYTLGSGTVGMSNASSGYATPD